MKIINIPRGYGKSTRAVWASELCDVPILTATEQHKKFLKGLAEKENVKMPDPITVSDLWNNKGRDTRFLERGIIIDEVFLVLTYLIYYVSGLNIPIKMVTFSENQYKTINFEQKIGGKKVNATPPIVKRSALNTFDIYECPECHKSLLGQTQCPKCGQVIDWQKVVSVDRSMEDMQ